MPTNRDIQIQLKLKDQFSKKHRTAMQRMRRIHRGAIDFMRKHWLKFAAAIAAVTYAVVRGMKSAINYVVGLDKMAKQADITTGQFARLAYAAEQEHTSIDTLTKAFPILTKYMEYARQGQEMYLREFRKMGIDVADGTGKIKTTQEVFLEMADYYSTAKDKTKALAIAVTLLGRRGAELVPLMKLGRKGLEELGDEAERLGLVVDDETAAAFKVFTDKVTILKMALKGMWIRVAAKQMDYMTDVVEKLTKFKWEAAAQHISSYIDKIREVVFATGRWIKEHADLLKIIGKTAAFAALAAVLVTLTASLITSTAVVYGFAKATAILTGVNLVQLSTACSGLIGTLAGANGLAYALGLVATALVAVPATAFIGWKIGKVIYEIKIVNKQLSKLSNWLYRIDVEGNLFKARLDLINKAVTLLTEKFGKGSEEVKKFLELIYKEGSDITVALRWVTVGEKKALQALEKFKTMLATPVTGQLDWGITEVERAAIGGGTKLFEEGMSKREKFAYDLNLKLMNLRGQDREAQLIMLTQQVGDWQALYGSDGELARMISEFYRLKADEIRTAEKELNQWQKIAADRTYNAMADSFKSIFVGTLKGELQTAADYFNAFRNSMINMIAEIMAKWAAMKLLGVGQGAGGGGGLGGLLGGIFKGLFGGGGITAGYYHQGGMIRAHNGLAMDEIPIIAQSGEGVLSRRGMANLGGSSALNRLNRGQEERDIQPVVHNYYNIQAMDVKSFQDYLEENKGAVSNAMMGAMDDNHPSRRGM